MRVLLQRVTQARVMVDDTLVGEIHRGLLLFVGVAAGDGDREVDLLTSKIANLRIFEDAEGKMNLSLLDLLLVAPGTAGALVVSQFTLYADVRKGRRPSFVSAAAPDLAAPLVERFGRRLGGFGIPVAYGQFGAHMTVDLVNDGPVTIWLDSADLMPPHTADRREGETI